MNIGDIVEDVERQSRGIFALSKSGEPPAWKTHRIWNRNPRSRGTVPIRGEIVALLPCRVGAVIRTDVGDVLIEPEPRDVMGMREVAYRLIINGEPAEWPTPLKQLTEDELWEMLGE